jgi:asparagine synthase (glutamine-hydrolysing)
VCGVLFTNRVGVQEVAFKRALAKLDHRGPDAQGIMLDGEYWLGHTRLSVVDLDSRSNQPFISQCGQFALIFNGEIFNFRELAAKHGIKLKTSSDTELVVELFANLGPKMLDELNGMFAIVIISLPSGEIFVARDRLGIKPLYVHEDALGVTLSSEIAPILELVPNPGTDLVGLEQYRNLRMFAQGRTLYNGISMFPPATFSVNGQHQRFWTLQDRELGPPSDQELFELIQSVIDDHNSAAVEIGSYLSGGIDSAIIATLSKVKDTWSVGTSNSNEFLDAAGTATFLNSRHSNIAIDTDEFLTSAVKMIEFQREPVCVPNEVLLYALNKRIKSTNTVMLSGEGADELFAGYSRIFDWAANRSTFDVKEFAQLYSYTDNPNFEVIESVLEPHYGKTPYETVSSFFQIDHLHGLLRRVDNASMRCGIEARVPYVDHRLVERLFCVAYEWKNHGGLSKAPLRRLLSRYLPPEVSNRKKIGFPVDVNAILASRHLETFANPYDSWYRFNANVLKIDQPIG